jgi:uncharacterized repeat protein (TIGR03803 family)
MQTRNAHLVLASIAASLTFMPATPAQAADAYKVLHSFGKGDDGVIVYGGVALDTKGNLYGTTSGGGAYREYGGTVYELSPNADGTWTEQILHSFSSTDPAGNSPSATPALDENGNIYATADENHSYFGSAFELSPGSPDWKLTIIHRFGPKDKTRPMPWTGIIRSEGGDMYGAGGCAFELSPGNDQWKYSYLHCFPAFRGDGMGPGSLVPDIQGNLYGVTAYGGENDSCGGGCGTAFELSHQPDGQWKETILHSFGAPGDGDFPRGTLVLDEQHNLYGVAFGGSYGDIFRISPDGPGDWKEKILYTIPTYNDGEGPTGGLVRDSAGNLYGLTATGGDHDCGVIFKLAPGPNDKWTYTLLHTFAGTDGCQPSAGMIMDDQGNLYGTTVLGGLYSGGTAFEISTIPSPQ